MYRQRQFFLLPHHHPSKESGLPAKVKLIDNAKAQMEPESFRESEFWLVGLVWTGTQWMALITEIQLDDDDHDSEQEEWEVPFSHIVLTAPLS